MDSGVGIEVVDCCQQLKIRQRMLDQIRYLLLRNRVWEDPMGELNISLDVNQGMTKPGWKMVAYLLRGLAFHANISS